MGESGGFSGDTDVPGGSFSRLLLSSDHDNERKSSFHVYNYETARTPALFSSNTPNMLCFGDFNSQTAQISSTLTYSDSSSVSSSGNTSNTLIDSKKRNGSGQESGQGSWNGQNNGKKKKNKPGMEPINAIPVGHAKVVKGRREKLGERIANLQQLVCPFGKTDTASVLHEAMGYIRFLHDQVKVLSSPYLQQRLPFSSSTHHTISDNGAPILNGKDSTSVLRSRGLCLVPVECIIDLANGNSADFWSSVPSSTAR